MKKAKGTMLLTIVKSIKVNHNKRAEYNEILSDEAKELLQKRILTASWYPLEVYKELHNALCFVEARNDPKTLFQWGLNEAKRLFTSIYQSTIVKNDLQLVLDNYTRFHRKVFNFGDVVVKFISDTELEFTYIDIPRDWENWYYIAVGYAVSFIELCIGKKADYVYLNKSWEGEGWTKVKYSWTN